MKVLPRRRSALLSAKRVHAFVAAAVATTLILSGCGASSGDGDSDSGGSRAKESITVVAPQMADTLDPHSQQSVFSFPFQLMIFDTLTTIDPGNLTPQPGLAESWEWIDPTTLQLKLKTGVEFTDGTPFNAEAVAFNIRRYLDLGLQDDLKSVTGATVVDDSRVNIELNRPDNSIVGQLGDKAGMMVSPAAVEKYGEDFGKNPVGTGPWKFVSQTANAVTYKRNDDYWGGDVKTRPETMIFKVIDNATTAANAVVSGQADFAYNLNVADIEMLKSANLVVEIAPTTFLQMVYFNLERLPDPKVRQALNLAIDREGLLKVVQEGMGEIADRPLPPTSADYQAPGDASPYQYDPERAKQLLSEAGKSNMTLSMVTFPSPLQSKITQVLTSQLAEIGITVELTTEETTTAVQNFFINHRYDSAAFNWSGRPTTLPTYSTLFGTETFQNAAKVPVPGMSDALAEFRVALDEEAVGAALSEMNQVLDEQAPYMPLYFGMSVVAHSKSVTGFYPDLLGRFIAIRYLHGA